MLHEVREIGGRTPVEHLIDEVAVPIDETDRDQFLADLEDALETVLSMHGLGSSEMQVIDGHAYSAIDDRCPECGDDLKLIAPSLDSHNGAYARASCECGWSGEAVYRLIDLHQRTSRDDCHAGDADAVEFEIVSENSSVSVYDIKPRHYPY